MRSGALPLVRFHAAAGSRVAMRLLVPALVAAASAAALLGPDFVASLARLLFGPAATGGAAAVVAGVCLAAAGLAAPRIDRGVRGWLRHLPVDGRTHRRAAALAVALAQAPMLLALLALVAVAPTSAASRLADALSLLVAAVAAGLAVVPCSRPGAARPLAIAAAVVAGAGGWGALALGAGLVLAADLLAGGLPAAVAARQSAGIGPPAARVAWRAVGPWRLAGACLVGALPLLAAFAFTHNNPLAPEHARLAARLGTGLAAALCLAQLAEALATRRPAWPWARSLPWSARRRAAADAVLLGLPAAALVVAGAALDPAALTVAAALPLLAVRAAGAVRRAPERLSGASGEILAEGALAAALLALVPWAGLVFLALVPLALRGAAERERRQKVSRWLEVHHLAAGDPQSWSAT